MYAKLIALWHLLLVIPYTGNCYPIRPTYSTRLRMNLFICFIALRVIAVLWHSRSIYAWPIRSSWTEFCRKHLYRPTPCEEAVLERICGKHKLTTRISTLRHFRRTLSLLNIQTLQAVSKFRLTINKLRCEKLIRDSNCWILVVMSQASNNPHLTAVRRHKVTLYFFHYANP